MTGDKTIGVVVPVYNGSETICRCITGLLRSNRRIDRIIVVDDGSTDGSGELARQLGVEVMRTADRPCGPSHARNVAAQQLSTDLIVFVDSDVVVDPQAVGRLTAVLEEDPDIAATFGSYDDDPDCDRVAALYANLRHHCAHQGVDREAETFWAGLGAIRRDAFQALDGFDESFAPPSIEDVELGVRLRQAGGHIRTIHEALGKHLKNWTLTQLWRTDIFGRAIPWARLIVEPHGPRGKLNAAADQKLAAILAILMAVTALSGALFGSRWWLATAFCTVCWMGVNRSLFRLLLRRGGLRGVLGGMLLHWVYYFYASFSYGYVWLHYQWQHPPRAHLRTVTLTAVTVLICVTLAGLIGISAMVINP